MATHPTTVTIYGRLSFPVFTHAEAVTRNATSPYPIADASKVAPGFNLLLEQPQLDKFVNFVTNDFLPYCAQQHAAGEKNRLHLECNDERTRKERYLLLLMTSGPFLGWCFQMPA